MAYKKTNKEKSAERAVLFSSTKFSYLISNLDGCNIISMKGGFQK